ncbi:uncharacterized protein DNG_04591 [Cephalotrichum gorgonifer]|uniref:Uncharacterized protein n=1 Tax=Cephalotrichum gorgonifer TaxID=2041049 RepID=A0AAE8SUP7_9PEZI|nr:uncharacterized protein DNG_04591 [Cephalotrichum gorgonifer]
MSFNPTPPQPYIGLWKNYADGGQLTLTLEETQAGILASFLVIFAGIAALSAWNIVRFLLHQSRSGDETHDGLHHQVQAILRNSSGLVQALQLMFQVAKAWRQRLGVVIVARRLSVVFFVAFIFFIGSTFAQLFISLTWSTAGAQFLVKTDSCSFYFPDVPDQRLRPDQAEYIYLKSRLEAAMMYERVCYSEGAVINSPDCSTLPVPVIEIEQQDDVCPFADQTLCISTDSVPVRMVATVNSNTHLGINAKPEDSIVYRRTARCSPIQNDHTIDTPDGLNFMYGPFTGTPDTEATFVYPDSLRSADNYEISSTGYDSASLLNGDFQWSPNSTIIGPPVGANHSATIFFIQTNNVTNVMPTRDPIFGIDPAGSPVKVLSCVEEHELCNPSLSSPNNCRSFAPADDIFAMINALSLNERQNGTALRVAINLLRQDLSQVVNFAPGDIVMAGKTVLYGEQYDILPVDQWRREVRRWFAMALYLLQSDAVQFSTPQRDATLEPYFATITDEPWLTSCKNQRIRNAEGPLRVRNFNFLAIVLILSLGFVFIALGGFVEPLTGLFRRVSGKNEDRALTWVFDGVLQLQRLAYGGVGVEKWQPGVADVPTTDEKMWPVIDLKVVATAESVYDSDGSPGSGVTPITPISKTSSSWIVKRDV